MDLTNKQVHVSTLTVSTFPPETTAKVEVREEVIPGVFKNIGTYNIKFNVAYTGTDEPALLAAINEKLLEIPE
jgi:hypothetical protein